jgi:nucleoid-associated protein Lsr2
MATKTEVHLIDDLDGESPASETVSFGLGSTSYEIDLSEQNAEELRAVFARYVDAGRRLGKGPGSPATRSRTESTPETLRAWAKANGYTVSPRGRIAASVVAAFKAAGN